MKNLENYILIIFFILLSSKIMSQDSITVIEIDSIYNDLYEESHIDSILFEFKTSINEVHTKMLLKMHVQDIEPLLVEIFDLPQ